MSDAAELLREMQKELAALRDRVRYLERLDPLAGAQGYTYRIRPQPLSGTWYWVNQGGATLTVLADGAWLYDPWHSSDNLRIYCQATPAAPYRATLLCYPQVVGGANASAGLCLHDTGTSRVVTWCWKNSTLSAEKYNSPSSYNSLYAGGAVPPPVPYFLRLYDDNTNRHFQIGRDGLHWVDHVAAVGRTDWCTPNRVGFFVNSYAPTGVSSGLLAAAWWLEAL